MYNLAIDVKGNCNFCAPSANYGYPWASGCRGSTRDLVCKPNANHMPGDTPVKTGDLRSHTRS